MKIDRFTLLLVLLAFLSLQPAVSQTFKPEGGGSSTGIIQILPTSPVLVDPNSRTENFIANEIASLSMGEVIRYAAYDVDWGDQQVGPALLKKSFTVARIEGTDMARITANPIGDITGKKIVEAIMQSYVRGRKMQEEHLSHTRLMAIDDELVAQSDLVHDNRKELVVLTQQYGIPYFEDHPITLGKLELESIVESRRKLYSVEVEIVLLEAKLATTENGADLHNELSRKVNELTRQKEKLTVWVQQLKAEAIDLSLKQSRFNQAVEAYERSKDLLKRMKLKQQEARVALKMPQTVMIVRQKPE
jgi:hypothetical protein